MSGMDLVRTTHTGIFPIVKFRGYQLQEAIEGFGMTPQPVLHEQSEQYSPSRKLVGLGSSTRTSRLSDIWVVKYKNYRRRVRAGV